MGPYFFSRVLSSTGSIGTMTMVPFDPWVAYMYPIPSTLTMWRALSTSSRVRSCGNETINDVKYGTISVLIMGPLTVSIMGPLARANDCMMRDTHKEIVPWVKRSGEGSEASEDESVNSEESEVSETEEVKEVIYGPPSAIVPHRRCMVIPVRPIPENRGRFPLL